MESLPALPIPVRLILSKVHSKQFESLFLTGLKTEYFYSTNRNFMWFLKVTQKIWDREQNFLRETVLKLFVSNTTLLASQYLIAKKVHV